MYSFELSNTPADKHRMAWQAAVRNLPIEPDDRLSVTGLDAVTFGHRNWKGRKYTRIWQTSNLAFIFDGQLHYKKELADKLGLQFEQCSTKELVTAAYNKWENDCPQHLYGQYSLAVINPPAQSAWLATGPLAYSAHPMYWAKTRSGLAVSSILPAIQTHEDVSNSLDFTALSRLALASINPDATAFQAIRLLPPGHTLRYNKSTSISRWWSPSLQTERSRSAKAHTAKLIDLFSNSIKEQLPTSGPVAAQLSGGLDSTLTSSIAAIIVAAHDRKIIAWTQRAHPNMPAPHDPVFDSDEWAIAKLVSAKYRNIDHNAVYAGDPPLTELFDKQHKQFKTPVCNSVNHQWITSIFSQAADLRCRKMLTGYMGNLTISYALGRRSCAWQNLKAGRIVPAAELLYSAGPKEPFRFLKFIVNRTRNPSDPTQIKLKLAKQLGLSLNNTLSDNLIEEHAFQSTSWRLRELSKQHAFAVDTRVLSGVETIDPTADRKVVEALLSLPDEAYFYKKYDRAPARLMGKNIVPNEISWRTRRGSERRRGAPRRPAR